MAKNQQPERAIHTRIVTMLGYRAYPDVLYLHPPNGGYRHLLEAMKLKKLGVLAGASDLLFWHKGHSYALELKAPGGRATDLQLEFLDRFRTAGGDGVVAEGEDEAYKIIESWNLVR